MTFLEKGMIGSIILIGLFLLIAVIFSPSCDELGGTEVRVGSKIVIVGKVLMPQPKYECIVKDKNE